MFHIVLTMTETGENVVPNNFNEGDESATQTFAVQDQCICYSLFYSTLLDTRSL